jgi:hypothetical protein
MHPLNNPRKWDINKIKLKEDPILLFSLASGKEKEFNLPCEWFDWFHNGIVFTEGTAEYVQAPSNGKIRFNEDLVHPTCPRHGHPAFLCYIDLYVTIVKILYTM